MAEKDEADRAGSTSELAFSLAEAALIGRDRAAVKKALAALPELGRAGEIALFAATCGVSGTADELSRALGILEPKIQLLMLDRFLAAPRPVDSGLLAWAARRLREIAGQEPEEVLLFLEHLAVQSREPSYPVQWALLRGQFGVWLDELLKLELEPEQVEYLARTAGLLHSPATAEALSELAGEHSDAAGLVVRAAERSGAVSRTGPKNIARKYLKHKDPSVRRLALSALIGLGSEICAQALALLIKRSPGSRGMLLGLALELGTDDFRAFVGDMPGENRAEDLWCLFRLAAEHDNERMGFALAEAGEKGGDEIREILPILEEPISRHAAAIKPNGKAGRRFRREPRERETREPGLLDKARRSLKDFAGKEEAVFNDEAGALRELAPGRKLGRTTVRNAELYGYELRENSFEKTVFSNIGMGAALVEDCVFSACRLNGVELRGSEIISSRFEDCEFELCVFTEALLDSAIFVRCTFKGCHFGGTTLNGVELSACLFSRCDFHAANISRAEVRGCLFAASNFVSALAVDSVFRGAAWRDCVFDNALFDACELRGCTSQSGLFAGTRFHRTRIDDPEMLAAREALLESGLERTKPQDSDLPQRLETPAAISLMADILERRAFERDAEKRGLAVLAHNRRRMQWATSKWGGRAADFVKLLPLLLESGAPVPGGKSGGPACRLPGYAPDYETLRLGEKYLAVEIPGKRPDDAISLEGLYSIGSVGTIAQTRAFDLDLWLCYEPGALHGERLKALKARIAGIEAWADREFGLEVHFFVMDMQSVRGNDFGFSDRESAGSTQAKLLKEEFYRTVVFMAGKKPAWWYVPARAGFERYSSELEKLGKSPAFEDDRPADLGHLEEVDKEEFFGASLWQIVKALKRPFKSVMKFAVLDRYFASGETGMLFCDRIKGNLFKGARDLWDVDAYGVLFEEIYEFYKRGENNDAMDLMRRAFRQKTRFSLEGWSEGGQRESAGSSFMEFFFPVSESPVERDIAPAIGSSDQGEKQAGFAEMVETGRSIGRFMFSTYENVQNKLAEENLRIQVSDEDMTKLGRKILAGFKQKPGKVMQVPFVDTPRGLYAALDIQCLGKPGKQGVWIARGLRGEGDGDDGKRFEEIVREKHPVSLSAWLAANSVYDPKMHVQGGNLANPLSLPDLSDLMQSLHEFFPHRETFDTPIEENLKQERATRVFTVLNLMAPREEKAYRDAQVIYSTNWGEMFCITDPEGLERLRDAPMAFIRANVPHSREHDMETFFHIPRKARCPGIE